MPTQPTRPPALMMTCIFVVVIFGRLLFDLMGVLSSGATVELQDSVRDALASEPLKGAGVTFEQALNFVQIAAYVGVALSVAGIVFAIFTIRGHQHSRIMLTILCVLGALAFASMGGIGLLPAVFAAMCAFMLWNRDTRAWFALVNSGEAAAASAGESSSSDAAQADPFVGQQPVRRPEELAAATPSSSMQSPSIPEHATAGRRAGERAPRPVRIAVLTTAISCAVVAFFGLTCLLLVTFGEDLYRAALGQPGITRDMLEASGMSVDDIISTTRTASTVWLVLSLLGLAAAGAAARRLAPGAAALLAMAIVTVAVSVFFLPVGIVTGAAAIVVVVQLRRPEARAWFAASRPSNEA